MTDYRITTFGGCWWIERYHAGHWHVYRGPYKRREGAERLVRKEMAA